MHAGWKCRDQSEVFRSGIECSREERGNVIETGEVLEKNSDIII
jgi:hypothetical protein